jgi:hypothetical protein
MIQAPDRVLARRDLLQGLDACDARVYRFVAGAGFGKSTLAWELARGRGPVSLCDLLGVRGEVDAWRRIITALSKLEPAEGERIAQESLTLALSDAAERNGYVHAIAQRGALRGVLLVENAEHLADEARLAPLRALLSGRPSCTVILCSRTDLALQLAQSYAPHEFLTVRERDLRFEAADFRRLLDAPAYSEMPERALLWSSGWPLAAARAVELLRRGENLPETADSESWLRELVGETMANAQLCNALLRLAAVPDASVDEIGGRLATAVPFVVERPDGSLEMHALAREELLRTYPGECRRARETVTAEATARGDHLRCAELALQGDDLEAAADALIRADHDFYHMPSSRYVAVLERLSADIVLQRPALWMVSEICLKSDFLALNGELGPVFRAKAHSLPPRIRMACAGLVGFRKGEYDGRWEEGVRLLDEFEREYSADCVRPRDFVYAAMYRNCSAAHSASSFDAAAYWREYGDELASANIFYGESLYLEAMRAYHRNDAAATLDALDAYIDHVRDCGYPVYRRASLYRSLFMFWEIGPREQYQHYRRELIDLLTDVATPNDLVARLAWELLDATTGVPPYREGPIVSTGCLANLVLAAESDDYDLLAAATHEAFAMSGNAALRSVNIKLSAAAFAFDPAAYEKLLDNAFITYDPSAAPALRACMQRLQAGENAGILEPLAARFRDAGERFRNRFFVDVTLARVRRAGVEIRLGDRELELLMLLAAAGRPLPALDLAEMLWPESDDASARNALKVCISRIRSRTGCKDLIVTSGGDVVLSAAHVQVDLDRAERLLRLAQTGSVAAMHAARAVLSRPLPDRYRSWSTCDSITARWRALSRT